MNAMKQVESLQQQHVNMFNHSHNLSIIEKLLKNQIF
jgi:hypothetical protein